MPAAPPSLALVSHIRPTVRSSDRPSTLTARSPGRNQLFGASVQPTPAATSAAAVASCLVFATTLKRTWSASTNLPPVPSRSPHWRNTHPSPPNSATPSDRQSPYRLIG